MRTSLPYFDEPTSLKRSLKADSPAVREATLRQASDIVTPIYHAWKEQLRSGGLTWQDFQSAASANQDAWRRWLSGELTWRDALKGLVDRLNDKGTSVSFVLAD